MPPKQTAIIDLDDSGYQRGMSRVKSGWSDFGKGAASARGGALGFGSALTSIAGPAMVATVAIGALTAAIGASVGAAIEWGTSMAGVAKTTGASGEALKAISSDLLELSTTVPVTRDALAETAQVAGQLGVATGDIAAFTLTASKMGVAFEMSASGAATAAAEINSAYGMAIDSTESWADSINVLGNNFAATEPQILRFVNSASGGGDDLRRVNC